MDNAGKKRYMRQVRSCLPCNGKKKRKLLDRLREELDGYLAENPEAGMEELRQRFGEPRQIAASYVAEMDMPELLRSLRFRRRIVSIAAAVAIGILLMWAAVVTTALVEHRKSVNGYFGEAYITEEPAVPLEEGEGK